MTISLVASPKQAVPPEVHEFAAEKGVGEYIGEVVDLVRRAFPSSTLWVSLGQDAEDEKHRYVALDVDAGDRSTEQLLASQLIWSAGIAEICPPQQAVYFVLGWR